MQTFKSNFMLFMSSEFGLISGKCTPVNNQVFDINCHLSISPCQVVQIENSYNWQTFRSECGCIHTGYKQESLQRELKMTHMNFAILNNYVTVIYLRFTKSSNFFVVKRNNLKQLYFSQLFILVYDVPLLKQENCQ